MNHQLGRRNFLALGSTVAGSLLLKSCATAQPPTGATLSVPSGTTPSANSTTIKVGILHSLTGTMSISEKSVVDAENLAIDEINAAGGLLGRAIEPVIEDGKSDWPTFIEKAKKLISQDKVATVFGCWTSVSRKAVLPIFEDQKHLLWYPVQYEGQECSNHVFYTGATPNQQIEPSVDWLLEKYKGKDFFLVGSEYIFPQTANLIIKAQLEARGGKWVGEDYIPLGVSTVKPIVAKIKAALPQGGVIYNTLNGGTNIAFFRAMKASGMGPDKYPVMSVSIAEEEVQAIGVEYLKGHFAAWNYFQTVDSPASRKFVEAFKAKFGDDRVVNDPMEAAYVMVHMWANAVKKAGKVDDLEAIKKAAYGATFDAPEGRVTMNANHHLSKFVRIGEVVESGLFKIVYETKEAIKPLPWNQFVPATKGFDCDFSDPTKGSQFRAA